VNINPAKLLATVAIAQSNKQLLRLLKGNLKKIKARKYAKT